MIDKRRLLLDRFAELVQEFFDSGFSETDNIKFQKILVCGIISFYSTELSNEEVSEISSEVVDYIQRRLVH